MRPLLVAGGLLGLLALALPVRGQAPPTPPVPSASTMPELATVKVQEVEIRSGGSAQFYPTGKLHYGDRVQIVNETKDWLTIKPPRGSFSWINAKFLTKPAPPEGLVTKPDAIQGLAVVLCDETAEVPVLAGSSLSKDMPNAAVANVKRGTIVDIVGLPKTGADNSIWVMVAPTPTEVRYIPATAVQRNTTMIQVTSSPLPNPSGATLPASQAVDARRKWLQWAYETEKDANKKQFFADELRALAQTATIQQTGGKPPNTLAPAQPPSTALYNGQPPANADWSPYGILRPTAFKKDGLPMYALEDRKTGRLLLYVTTKPGMSLNDYLNRQITLFGQTSYYSDNYVRSNVLEATHVAAMPN